MFKKFKDRLTEVSEEVKKDPRFQNSLASVNKLAQDTFSTLNTKPSNVTSNHPSNNNNTTSSTLGDDLSFSGGLVRGNNDHFFSIADDDESLMTPPNQSSPVKESADGGDPASQQQAMAQLDSVELTNKPNPGSGRARRSSSGETVV